MRVHELASELDTESSAVIEAAQAAGIDVNHASNSLSDEEAATVREALAPGSEAPEGEQPAGADAEKATPKAKTVIDKGAPKNKAADRNGPARSERATGYEASLERAAERRAKANKLADSRPASVVLTGKGSVTAFGLKVLRGEAPPAKWLAKLPKGERAHFSESEAAEEGD